MNDKEKSLCLMELVHRKVYEKTHKLAREHGNLASLISEKKVWKMHEKDNIGFSTHDYTKRIENARKRHSDAQIGFDDWHEIQKYCYEKFIKEGV